MGRPRDLFCWDNVEKLSDSRWKCKHCKEEFAGAASRIRNHLSGQANDIRSCQLVPSHIREQALKKSPNKRPRPIQEDINDGVNASSITKDAVNVDDVVVAVEETSNIPTVEALNKRAREVDDGVDFQPSLPFSYYNYDLDNILPLEETSDIPVAEASWFDCINDESVTGDAPYQLSPNPLMMFGLSRNGVSEEDIADFDVSYFLASNVSSDFIQNSQPSSIHEFLDSLDESSWSLVQNNSWQQQQQQQVNLQTLRT